MAGGAPNDWGPWGPPHVWGVDEPVWEVWVVEIWITIASPRIARGWQGRRCGRWYHYSTVNALTWVEINNAFREVETGGLYNRMAMFIEAWEWSRTYGWDPIDHV